MPGSLLHSFFALSAWDAFQSVSFFRFLLYFWIFMATYIFPFWKHFFSTRTMTKTDVRICRRTNAPTCGSFTAKHSKGFPFTWFVEPCQSPKLQMKVLFVALKVTLFFLLELFDTNDFESDNSEEKNHKIESFANEINLPK